MAALVDYQTFSFDRGGIAHDVYYGGAGLPILLMHELPGLVQECRQLADKLIAEGFEVYMPLMFGEFDAPFSGPRTILNVPKLCIQREFSMWARRGDSPILEWLRGLAGEIATRSGHEKVGAIGMCLTGNFALSLIAEPAIEAAVGSQPTLPLFGPSHPAIDRPEKAKQAAEKLSEKHGGPAVLSYRFENDPLCAHKKLTALSDLFGATLRGVEIPGNKHAMLTAHFALPHDQVEVPADLSEFVPRDSGLFRAEDVWRDGEPTHRALIEIIAFLKDRLSTDRAADL